MAKKKAVKKLDDLTGTVIKLTKDQGIIISGFMEEVDSLEVGMSILSERIRRKQERMWKVIFDFHPKIEDYHTTYNRIRNDLTVVAKKRTRKE